MDPVDTFLAKHPAIETLEVLVPDVNGVLRGKQLPAGQIKNLFSGKVMLPRATVLLDTQGHASDKLPYGIQDGDPDSPVIPIADTLVPVSWTNQPTAQILGVVSDHENSAWFANSVAVLERCLSSFAALKLQPVIAIELEFHLLQPDKDQPRPARANSSLPEFTGPQTYNLEHLADYSDFILDVQRVCNEQDIALGSAITEYGEGQFEINLLHTKNVASACHQAIMLKRIVRQIAIRHQYLATFMAKPMADNMGNGLHVHFSLLNESGQNVFASELPSPSPVMQKVIAGVLDVMPESMALFAPNANSYRRFQNGNFAPMSADWGVDHRAVAVRIPRAQNEDARIEHRVAGADANPYLVVAAILAGVIHGFNNELALTEPVTGTGDIRHGQSLPTRWFSAIERFGQSTVLQQCLGAEFCALYQTLKADEESYYHQLYSSLDYHHYVRVM